MNTETRDLRDRIATAYRAICEALPAMTPDEVVEAGVLLQEGGALLREPDPKRYEGPDANGDKPCVLTSGLSAEDEARYAKLGADVLAEEV